MAYIEIDKEKTEIRIIYPTNKSLKKIKEYEEELNNYPIKINPIKECHSRNRKIAQYDINHNFIKIWDLLLTVITNKYFIIIS